MKLDEQRRSALQSLARYDSEFALLREAKKSAPVELCEAYAAARATLSLLERDLAKEREMERQVAELAEKYQAERRTIARVERHAQR